MTVRSTWTWITLAGLMLAGLWLRVRHLGELGLVADEGIQALAVRGILEHGYPLVPSGEVYLRSPLFLYAQALSAKLFGTGPFGLRLPSALFGVCAIPATFALGRCLFDRTTGLLAAAVVTFSAWEIEISRYARFYALFQVLFVLSALWFFRGFVRRDTLSKLLFAIAALLTVPTHRLSLLLAILFVVPWVLRTVSWRRRLLTIPWLAGMTLLILYDVSIFFRLLVPEPPQFEIAPAAAPANPDTGPGLWLTLRGAFRLPSAVAPDLALFDFVASIVPWAVAGLAALLLGVALLVASGLLRERRPLPALLLTACLAAALLHLFGVALAILVVYLMFFARDLREVRERPLLLTVSGTLAALAFWVAATVFIDTGLDAANTVLALFGYPPFGGYFLSWYVRGWPLVTLGLVAGSTLLLVRFVRDRSDDVALFTLSAIYLLAIAASLFVAYREARYTYHFHPLVVIVASYAAVRAGRALAPHLGLAGTARRAAAAVAVVLLLLVTDANPVAAWRIGERTYASEKNPLRSPLSWTPYADFHQDYESAGEFVARERAPDEPIVAFGAIHMGVLHHLYSGGLDFVVVPSGDPGYYAAWKDGTLVNNISGARNLDGAAGLEALLAKRRTGAWILADRRLLRSDNPFYGPAEKRFLEPLAARPDFLARDGETFAAHVGPGR